LIATTLLARHGTPPYSPNIGGPWEAGVKLVKDHLKRIFGNHKPIYEELATVLIRIEAYLNSRSVSNFCLIKIWSVIFGHNRAEIGCPIFTLAQNGVRKRKITKSTKLVLIKDDKLPLLQWTLGRITSLHPREDSLVGVVTLKTKSGSQKRSISKL